MLTTRNSVFASLLFVAIALPWQISANLLPNTSYINEFLAFAGWGAVVWVMGSSASNRLLNGPVKALLAALLLLVAAACLQLAIGHVRQPAVVAHFAYFIFSAGLLVLAGYRLPVGEVREKFLDLWAWVWLAGCALGLTVALIQYFRIDVAWYLASPLVQVGRISGNIRQTNHFATLMALGLPCIVWLNQRQQLGKSLAILATLGVVLPVLLSGSRTGQLMLVWMVLCMVANRSSRWLALVTALSAVGLFGLLIFLDGSSPFSYVGAHRVSIAGAALSASDSRFPLWLDALALIAQNPLIGVGLGQFEFYMVLSDKPFDLPIVHINAHMLPLQIAAEYGLPVAILFFSLLIYGFWSVRRTMLTPAGWFAATSVAVILIHSMAEFPLWYAYFLLPFSFFSGLLMGLPPAAERASRPTEGDASASLLAGKTLKYGAALLVAGTLVSVPHYLALASIYSVAGEKDTFEGRVTTAEKAFLYQHWVMFSALTLLDLNNVSERPETLPLYEKGARFFMDEGFMAKYALVLAANGKLDHARRVIYGMNSLQSKRVAILLAYCEATKAPGCAGLVDIIQHPAPPKVSARDFN